MNNIPKSKKQSTKQYYEPIYGPFKGLVTNYILFNIMYLHRFAAFVSFYYIISPLFVTVAVESASNFGVFYP